MNELLYARAQMGLSLAFHMAFAAAGVALPLVLVVAEAMHRRTRDPDWLELAKRMAKGTSILFAVGAVSGTVLSFELGLLWPSFMGTFGEVIGLPFSLEGFAFFTEAIFLGVYLYGRDRIAPKLHFAACVGVAVSGALSAFFVTCVNACMNLPSGFVMRDGKPADVDPIAAMFSAPFGHETIHTLLSCYQATAWALAGIHAWTLLKDPASALFRKAFAASLAIACATALLQPLSGHHSATRVAEQEPVKLAAAEALFHTQAHAPLTILGIADDAREETRFAIEIPGGLSLLAHGDPSSVVEGLDRVPPEDRPNARATHLAFDVMVGCGGVMAALAALTAWLAFRRRGVPSSRWLLRAWVLASPLGLVAMEAGWCVTELGRQPWIVHGAMRTRDAVTPFHYLEAPFWTFGALYAFLGVTVVYLLWRQLRAAPRATTTKEATA